MEPKPASYLFIGLDAVLHYVHPRQLGLLTPFGRERQHPALSLVAFILF